MKKHTCYSLFFIVLIFYQHFSFAQKSKIDSLYSFLKAIPAKTSGIIDNGDTIRIITLTNIAWEQKNNNPETAIAICTQALNLSFELFKTEKTNSPLWKIREKYIFKSYKILAVIHKFKGDYPLALDCNFKALKISESLNDKKGISLILGNIGIVCELQGNYPNALDYYFKALKIAEEVGDQNGIGRHLGNIGIVYRNQGDYSKALDYYFKALGIAEKLKDKNAISGHLINIGLVYYNLKEYTKALDYFLKALKIEEALNRKNEIAINLGNIGNVYFVQKDYPKALDYYLNALKIADEVKDKNEIAIMLGNIGETYINLKKHKEAEEYLQKAVTIGARIGALTFVAGFEGDLSDLYTQTNQPAKALEHYKKYVLIKDSLFNEENTKKTVRAEMNFEFEKKETTEKVEQEKQNIITQTEKQKQKIILILVSSFLLLVVVFAGFMFNRWRITQKQKLIIDAAYHQIEEKNKEITDSINYALRIQQAMLTSEEYISKFLSREFFIFYQPKDIVSGDFYWAYSSPTNNRYFYIATADCTGHGVPGAFMSLLNINFLNENVIERNLIEPNKILNEQRKEIIKALNPKGTENSKDGMDCVLCRFDFDTMLLTYAAANNPIWILRNQELLEFKADKMPVGKYNEEELEFSQQIIQLQKGDIVYTFTDGFVDQFGGLQGKKFKYKQLSDLLVSISPLSMIEQKNILDKTINEWKGNLDQVDDMLIIGIKI
jgi:serine phosphatase RsbU (regulator of sigma subunit)/Tfp pilus assembly protein PilF